MAKTKDLAIVFWGALPLSIASLEALIAAGYKPTLIVTEPDAPGRRGGDPILSPTKVFAEQNGIEVLQPRDMKSPELDAIRNSEWDLFIVAAYGKFLPKSLLNLPKHGTLNVHPSLLPKYRGPSPIRSQILGDDPKCGVSIILLDEEMDHGPILAQSSVEFDRNPDAEDGWPIPGRVLDDILAEAGADLLVEILPGFLEGSLNSEPQNHTEATFTKKIQKEDGRIDLADDPYQNYLKICAYDGWPGTYFLAQKSGKDIRVKITDAEFKDGALAILRVIPEGKKEMAYNDFMKV